MEWQANAVPTSTTCTLDRVPVRVWAGRTPAGSVYYLYVHRVAWPFDEPLPPVYAALLEDKDPPVIVGAPGMREAGC